MYIFIIFLSINCIGVLSAGNESPFQIRIVGGSLAQPGQFPYQVSIRTKKNDIHFCGGSIIDERHVLTASHCMFASSKSTKKVWNVNSIRVWAGGTVLDVSKDTSKWKSYNVENIFTHDEFNVTTFQDNDIAVIRIKGTFPNNSKTIQPIGISSNVKNGTKCNISGWGKTEAGKQNELSSDLMYATVNILNKTNCTKAYKPFVNITQNMICAGTEAGGVDSCQGDSGGPLVCNRTLTGIVSFGIGCANKSYPGVYTNVLSYNLWIKKAIQRSVASYISTNNVFLYAIIIASIIYLVLF